MSNLFKLSIQGVRSFDSESSETIEFGFPLTLICGQNGCGKTTIIECLKYATTGDLPPNSKGGTFVNDPSIAARNTVNAQVKLAFQNVNGKSMICTRTMQLTKKRGKGVASNTFKTLEGQLSIMDQGQKSTISTKNAELDSQIPVYLGASRAILDYVIFCHQDDSLWPLSEASVLKKRFDDIFEALKFTKVLDSLKTIKKDMSNDIKLIDQNVQHLRVDKSRADKIRNKVESTSVKCDVLSEEIANLTSTIEEKEQEAEALFVSNQSFQEILSRHEQLQYSQKSCQIQLERIMKNIEILPDTETALMSRLDNFESHLQERQAEASIKLNELQALEEKLQSLRLELNSLARTEGSLRLKEELYQANKQKLVQLIQENLLAKNSRTNEMNFQKIVGDLENTINKATSAYERLRSSNKASYEQAASRVHEISQTIAKLEQRYQYYQQDLLNTRSQISEGRKKLSTQQQQEAELEVHKRELKDLEDKYDPQGHNDVIKSLDSLIENERTQLAQLESQSDTLGRKANQASKQSDTLSKMSFIKEGIARKEATLGAHLKSLESLFEQTTGKQYNNTGSDELEAELTREGSRLDLKLSEHKNISKHVESLTVKLESTQAQITDNLHNTTSIKNEIVKVIEEDEIDTYEQVISDLEENHRDALESLNTFEVTNQFKIKAIEIAESEKYCTLCLRHFDSPGLSKFLTELRANIKSMTAEALEKEVKETAKELEQAKNINPLILKYRQYGQELPELEAKKTKETQQMKDAEKLKVKVDSELESLQSNLDALKALRTPLAEVSRIRKEIDVSQKELASLEELLSDYGSVTKQSPVELQREMDKINREMKALRQNVSENVEAKYVKQRELARLEGRVKDKKLAISALERALIDQGHEKSAIEGYEAQVVVLQQSISEIEHELGFQREKRKEEDENLRTIKVEIEKAEHEKETEINRYHKLKDQISNLLQNIKEFENTDRVQFETVSSNIATINSNIEELEVEMLEIRKDIKVVEKSINEANNLKSQIRDNLDYRRLQNEMNEIENQIGMLDIEDAQSKRNEYNERTKEIRLEITNLNSEHAGKVGEVKQLRDQIRMMKEDLDSEYVDVDERYQAEWVKLQTNMLATSDLQTYSKALDNAIMKYHTHKMESINRILNELWKQTYKGTDVDTIAIKSDINLHAKGNRSYNYRVVMYKQDCELDMRGRCSAGQKVLTSILIRLALAECFGSNCGIIALDEPTTNLDVENTESLAQSLNNIIEFRRGQKNFQLIVITHDEKFLSHIGGEQFTDNFYRVQRDENQRSIIRSLPINFILEE